MAFGKWERFVNFAYEKITKQAVIAQLVEQQLPKLRVASSSLVYRSRQLSCWQSGEYLIVNNFNFC